MLDHCDRYSARGVFARASKNVNGCDDAVRDTCTDGIRLLKREHVAAERLHATFGLGCTLAI